MTNKEWIITVLLAVILATLAICWAVYSVRFNPSIELPIGGGLWI